MHDRGMQFGSAPGGTSRRGWRLGGRAESVADEFDDGGVFGLAERDVALPLGGATIWPLFSTMRGIFIRVK
jgi:hypothetical protein